MNQILKICDNQRSYHKNSSANDRELKLGNLREEIEITKKQQNRSYRAKKYNNSNKNLVRNA